MLGRTNTGGGGGGGLNFQIIDGTTKPNNPKVNTIFVNTSVKAEGYVFSATEPSSAEGFVWIPTGTSSTVAFNALKKNTLQVYPTGVKQCISGKWENKEAWMYNGTSWLQFSSELFYLFDNGNVSGYTGGWTETREGYSNGSTAVGNTIHLHVSKPSSGTAGITLGMTNTFNANRQFSELGIVWGDCGFANGTAQSAGMGGNPEYKVFNGNTVIKEGVGSAPSGTSTFDISNTSNLQLKFYAKCNYYRNGTYMTLIAKQIWLKAK